MRMDGLAVSEGVVLARVYVIERDRGDALPVFQVPPEAAEGERARLQMALDDVVAELDQLVTRVAERIGPAQAEIFVAQRMMVQDPSLRDQMWDVINNEHLNAEAAGETTAPPPPTQSPRPGGGSPPQWSGRCVGPPRHLRPVLD